MESTSGTKKRGRGERGIASFQKKIARYHIEFDENNIPIGELSSHFNSWYGLLVRQKLPYYLEPGKLGDEYFKALWLETKRTWNIENDPPGLEHFMKKRAVRLATNFRSRLVTEFVNKSLNACEKYPFLNPDHWEDFVAQKTSAEFKAKSDKAKTSSAKNKFKPRLGRSGWKGMDKKKDKIWLELVARYESLGRVTNARSKLVLISKAIKNKETKSYELPPEAIEEGVFLSKEEQSMIADGSYALNKEDPVIRLLGPEHGGRSRTVSDIIGFTKVQGGLIKNVNHDILSVSPVDTSPNFRGASSRSGSGGRSIDYPPITTVTACELLLNVADSRLKVAFGMTWPMAIHGMPILEGCVKVQVDEIVTTYENLPVYAVTHTDKVTTVKDMLHTIVQWPRHALELADTETSSESTSASRMHSGCALPQAHGDDPATTSCYCPQEDNDSPL